MFILASKSPRRIELMKKFIASSFLVVPSNKKEIIKENLSPEEIAVDIASQKGEAVFALYPNDVVISADTIVVYDKEILGKPSSKEDAFKMLKKLNGKTHQIITGYFIKNKEIEIRDYTISSLSMKEVNDDILREYIEKENPLDKAGSYGIQDKYFETHLLLKFEGSKNNIIGFPIEDIKTKLIDHDLLK